MEQISLFDLLHVPGAEIPFQSVPDDLKVRNQHESKSE